MPQTFPTPTRKAQISERRKMVWDLRLRGKELQAIAEEIWAHYRKEGREDELPKKYGVQGVHDDFKAIMAERAALESKEITDHVRLDASRLDTMIEVLWDRVTLGDTEAIETVRRLLERRSKLLGLNAPDRVDHTTGGLPLVTVKRVSTAPPPAEDA
jgi:hypothetical protein